MSRKFVAVDLDGTLAEAPYDPENPTFIGPLKGRGRQLLEGLVADGFLVMLFTGRIHETCTNSDTVVKLIQDWLEANGIAHLISRIWPHPKPHFSALVDDRAVRWRGDPELSLLEVRSACRWVDAMKEKA